MKQIPASLLTLTAGVLVTLVSLWVGQNHGLLPEQASAQAPLVDNFFNVMVTIGTALFLLVEGTIVLFVIRYRRRQGDDTDGIPVEGNLPLEAFWTAIPSIIVIGLSVLSVEVFQEMGGLNLSSHGGMHSVAAMTQPAQAATGDVASSEAPDAKLQYGIGAPVEAGAKPADLVVNVTGVQYAWLFNYPESGIMAGELHVPVGQDVQLNLTGQDVIHSFWVPQFRLKQDAIPGVQTELRFVATKPGTYPVVCTELCGSYHGGMRSQVIVQPQAEFDQWLIENRVAQHSDATQTVALHAGDRSPADFLAPYAQEMGVTETTLAQLQSHHHP